MAIKTLITADPDFTQNSQHDLESFLYIILYVCTFTREPGVMLSKSQIPPIVPLQMWFNNVHPLTIGFLKAGHMLRPDISVIPYLTAYWDDFKPFILEMIQECFVGDLGKTNHLTHDKMIDILQRAFGAIQESPQTGSKRSNEFENDQQNKKGKQILV
jgi:hypothetical protein